jgi:transcription initiation factor TFIID subunit 5
MSVATPTGSSQSPAATSPANADATGNLPATDRVIIEYLRARGHSSAVKVLLDDLEAASPSESGKPADTIGSEEFMKVLSVFAQKPSKPGENVLKDSGNVLQELNAMGNPANIQALIASISSVGAEELLSLDPMDKYEGFRELEAWVDGSLDMYRVCVASNAS